MTRTAVVGRGLMEDRPPSPSGRAATTAMPGYARERGTGVSMRQTRSSKPFTGPTSSCSRSPRKKPPRSSGAAAAAPKALITDAASLKRPIAAAAAGLPASVRFVAGHPMADRGLPASRERGPISSGIVPG